MSKKLKAGGVIVGAAAALIIAGCAGQASKPAASKASPVKCSGINSCKGTSECASATNACKGQNGCKGKGWVFAKSADLCKKKGGKVLSVVKSDNFFADADHSENLASIDDNKAYRR